MTPSEFFKKYGGDIVSATLGTPLFPSVKAAQAALETGYGKSIPTNNLFGIKATGAKTPYWNGAGSDQLTREVFNGQTVYINDGFRKYATMADSIRDHSYVLITLRRYKAVREAKTPEAQADALQSCGYATDPMYAASLKSIIKDYSLKELDKKKNL